MEWEWDVNGMELRGEWIKTCEDSTNKFKKLALSFKIK